MWTCSAHRLASIRKQTIFAACCPDRRQRHAPDHLLAGLVALAPTLADNDSALASAILDQVQPESPDNSAPTVSACIGIALGLLDDWLGTREPPAPPQLAQRVRLPKGHWQGERAARDILALAGQGRAFRSLGSLITR